MRIDISPHARTDLRSIWLHIAEHQPAAASRLLRKIETRFEMFSRQPLIGEPCFHLGNEMRCHSVVNYVIYYRPTPEAIRILRVLHGARDITQIPFPDSE